MRVPLLIAALLLAGCGSPSTSSPASGGTWPAGALGDPVPATWSLADPNAALDPQTTELAVMVAERPCSSGSPIEGRTSEPAVEMTATSVTITIRVRELAGIQSCPLHLWPMTVRLPEPLRGRQLMDGGRVPPGPPEAP